MNGKNGGVGEAEEVVVGGFCEVEEVVLFAPNQLRELRRSFLPPHFLAPIFFYVSVISEGLGN